MTKLPKSGTKLPNLGMLIALHLMTIFVTGCSAIEPVEYCEPVTLYQDKIVDVPKELTDPVELADLDSDFDLIDLGVAYKFNRTRALQCNSRLEEISRIGNQE
jgi:hypothetical protein